MNWRRVLKAIGFIVVLFGLLTFQVFKWLYRRHPRLLIGFLLVVGLMNLLWLVDPTVATILRRFPVEFLRACLVGLTNTFSHPVFGPIFLLFLIALVVILWRRR